MPDDLNVDEQLEKAKEAVGSLSGDLLKYVIFAIVALIVLYILYKVLTGRKKKKPAARSADLTIDVMALGSEGPPAGTAVLEYYNVPVRLAAIVLAPAGRVRELPPPAQLGDIYDAIVPGLAKVVASHRPLVRRWPPQVSAKGFAHTVFQHCRLPGDGGKGTPWSSVAGLLKIEGHAMMAGLILRTESTSSHGQEIIEREEQWLSILRAKASA